MILDLRPDESLFEAGVAREVFYCQFATPRCIFISRVMLGIPTIKSQLESQLMCHLSSGW